MEKIKKSDICLKKIINKKETSKIFVKINKKVINFQIKDLNIYNILASLAVLNELKLICQKLTLKILNPLLGEEKNIIFQGMIKTLS